MKDEMKKKLHYELVERRIRLRNDTATFLGFAAFLLMLFSTVVPVNAAYTFITSKQITIDSVQHFISTLGVCAFFFGISILLAIYGVADYFDRNRKIDEAERLYAEVVE